VLVFVVVREVLDVRVGAVVGAVDD